MSRDNFSSDAKKKQRTENAMMPAITKKAVANLGSISLSRAAIIFRNMETD
jgi:hypothetical protein